MTVISNFVRDRDEALRSLDETKIRAYMARYEIESPAGDLFWAGVHKARLSLTSFSEAEKQVSRVWLAANGFKASGL